MEKKSRVMAGGSGGMCMCRGVTQGLKCFNMWHSIREEEVCHTPTEAHQVFTKMTGGREYGCAIANREESTDQWFLRGAETVNRNLGAILLCNPLFL